MTMRWERVWGPRGRGVERVAMVSEIMVSAWLGMFYLMNRET